ncbi:hypothetical protein B0H67DRAFT_495560 [Lasiosphaeris hirsuta]|uniref:Uncharacterized protein n=1 Tax=Lasiosphaeris hirsuta TaxID=260670 RepID=A0AA40A1P3_9PEZI|nr:hypothetical protein B0H67DRAFT_495560 [Lasiosphaeris hirsuta]
MPAEQLLAPSPGQASASSGDKHHDLVTLIITTSPTPSAPSTELISAFIVSFKLHCPELAACRVILVLDTFERITNEARLKKGHVTADGAEKFDAYKDNAKGLILREYGTRLERKEGEKDGDYDEDSDLLSVAYGEAEYGADAYAQQTNAVPLTITSTQDGRVTFIEPSQRLGFGLAIRSALRVTKTPYVWVQQHDWSLVSDIPLCPILDLMRQQQPDDVDSDPHAEFRQVVTVPIKYVCFPSIRMINYATSEHVMQFPALRALTNLHKQNFSPPARLPSQPGDSESDSPIKIPLTPLFFWHDKPHLAETDHYLAKVFPNRLAMPRGAFIEDTAGQRARTEMKDGRWKKWACWLYYPGEGKQLCVRHLKGRTFRGAEGEIAQKLEYMRLSSLES